jgi:hypothetical protein
MGDVLIDRLRAAESSVVGPLRMGVHRPSEQPVPGNDVVGLLRLVEVEEVVERADVDRPRPQQRVVPRLGYVARYVGPQVRA